MFGGLGVAPWLDVIARVVPGRLRGRFMGRLNTVGALLGAGSAAVAAPLLDWYPFPYNFAACFGLAAGIYLVGLTPLFLVREPPGPPPGHRVRFAISSRSCRRCWRPTRRSGVS